MLHFLNDYGFTDLSFKYTGIIYRRWHVQDQVTIDAQQQLY